MKLTKTKVLKTFNALIALLLAVIGFGSCLKDLASFYGTPHARFKVNGNVVSSETSKPIKNIRVIFSWDTVVTDQAGNYKASIDAAPWDTSFHLVAEDIDSTLNGEFEKADTLVTFKDAKFSKGDGDWYKGETSKEFNLKLDPKK